MKRYHYSSFLVFCMFLCFSCTNKKNYEEHYEDNEYEKEDETTEQMYIDLPIGVNLVPLKNEYGIEAGTDSPDAFMYFKVSNETDDLLEIEPNSSYYNIYASSMPMSLWDDAWKDFAEASDELTYPSFDFVITNTTDKTINVSSLTLEIEDSKVDKFPYLWIFEVCGNANSITIWNESWYDWGNMYLSYSILKKGESFDGKYKKKMTIPYFDDLIYVDFLPDLVEMGLKEKEIDNVIHQFSYNDDYDPKERISYIAPYVVGRNASASHIVRSDAWIEPETTNMAELFYPFEFTLEEGISTCGFARIYGKIEFENSTFSKEFYGRIFLNPPGYGGAENELSDEYDIELKTNESNYELDIPYTCSLSPGEITRVRFSIKCSKSTNHRFKVRANNSAGMNIKSKNIQLHLINSRHSTKQPEIIELYPPL